MSPVDFDKLKPNENYYEEINKDIWLTDNHKWAFYVWEKHLSENNINTVGLVHIDYHWDSTDDISDQGLESDVKNWTLEEIEKQITIRSNGPIRWDSFIAPFVYRERVKWIKWLCFEDEEEPGFTESSPSMPKVQEEFFDDSEALSSSNFDYPFILDLCLDYFTTEGDGIDSVLRDTSFVGKVLGDCESVIKEAELITISVSFTCFYNADDARKLAKIVIPKILSIRASA